MLRWGAKHARLGSQLFQHETIFSQPCCSIPPTVPSPRETLQRVAAVFVDGGGLITGTVSKSPDAEGGGGCCEGETGGACAVAEGERKKSGADTSRDLDLWSCDGAVEVAGSDTPITTWPSMKYMSDVPPPDTELPSSATKPPSRLVSNLSAAV